jgi:hypothetical protein
MFRKHGGGYGMGAPLVAIPVNDFSVKVPINQAFDDCAFPARPGQIVSQPDVALAQVAMAGGSYSSGGKRAWGKSRRNRGMSGGDCGCSKVGGTRRRMRGGVYAVDTSQSVGGSGPNVMPVYATVPCDARAGATTVAGFNPDPRAPVTLYSLTPNQSGGASPAGPVGGVSGAPGSLIPVYNSSVAGFTFVPSNAEGSPLPAGVAVFNEVVPQVARVGGANSRRKSRKHRQRKSKGSRKH